MTLRQSLWAKGLGEVLSYNGKKKMRRIFLTPVDLMNGCLAGTDMIGDVLHRTVSGDTRWYIKGSDLHTDAMIFLKDVCRRGDFDIVSSDFAGYDRFLSAALIRMEGASS